MSKNDIMQTLNNFITTSNLVIENETMNLLEKNQKIVAIQKDMKQYSKGLKQRLNDRNITFNIDAITYAHSAINYLEVTSESSTCGSKREIYLDFLKTLRANTLEFSEILKFQIE